MIFNLNIENYPDFGEFGVAPCAEVDPDAFYPVDLNDFAGGAGTSKYYNEAGAKAVCRECPYMMRCLVYAVENNEMGIWGGTTDSERKSIRRAIKSGTTLSQIEVRIKR
jgi:WhiB family redox-sensing transcriptional regulator